MALPRASTCGCKRFVSRDGSAGRCYDAGVKAAPAISPDDLLKAAGLRRTPVRIGVLNILAASKVPMDTPSIVGKIESPTDTVTVYRTLNTFTRKKLVHRVSSDGGWRYAMGRPDAKASHQHPHFICDECGAVDCLSSAAIPRNLVRSLGVERDYLVSYPEVVLHGRCPKCH